jgi:hypothetical protein
MAPSALFISVIHYCDICCCLVSEMCDTLCIWGSVFVIKVHELVYVFCLHYCWLMDVSVLWVSSCVGLTYIMSRQMSYYLMMF